MAKRKKPTRMEFEVVHGHGPMFVQRTFEEKPLSPENERILRAIQTKRLRELLKRHPPRPST
jgi:hypothetical protein